MFKLFINNLNEGMEWTLSKFAVADTPGGWAAIQHDLEKLENWV